MSAPGHPRLAQRLRQRARGLAAILALVVFLAVQLPALLAVGADDPAMLFGLAACALLAGAVAFAAATVALRTLLLRPIEQWLDHLGHISHDAILPPNAAGGDDADPFRDLRHAVRTASWTHARLAAVSAAVGRLGHDLRGLLAPAMLAAERMQGHADPLVSRTGDMVMRSVERSTEAIRHTVEFTREVRIQLPPARLPLRPLIEDAAVMAWQEAGAAAPILTAIMADGIEIDADRDTLRIAFAHLLRNAATAGARSVEVSANAVPGTVHMRVADDGRGLPEAMRANPFRPANTWPGVTAPGAGPLGLAIARDLLLANGGDIALAGGNDNGNGTTFAITLVARSRNNASRP
jgi:signal transduction histidine kinase